MATYIVLLNFTKKAVQEIKHAPDRLASAKERARKRGGEIKSFYLTLGTYDAITVVEAPDDQTLASFLLETASLGFVRTTTLRAFDENDYKKIVSAI